MKRRVALVLVLGLLPWAALHAQQTAQTTFRVQARVNAVCEITASDLDFGTYSAQGATALQATTLLRATCTPQTTYNVGLMRFAGEAGSWKTPSASTSSASSGNQQASVGILAGMQEANAPRLSAPCRSPHVPTGQEPRPLLCPRELDNEAALVFRRCSVTQP